MTDVGFAKAIKEKNNWIISYNDSKYIRDLYQGYEIIETGWSYGMHGGQAKEGELVNKSSEILILNGIDPDHIAAANEQVQRMRAEELEKKKKAATKKFKKLFKEQQQQRWAKQLKSFRAKQLKSFRVRQ